jgi:glyoxylase-like metal-dependent hydrolase (beta-lactamase superfamily II)
VDEYVCEREKINRGGIMKEATLFTSTKISDSVTRISGITGELMYLVKGKERAALLDTGIGAGNIKGYAEGLTSLPLVVFLTHGHMDHAGGAFLFEDVYLHRKDWNCLKQIVRLTSGVNMCR